MKRMYTQLGNLCLSDFPKSWKGVVVPHLPLTSIIYVVVFWEICFELLEGAASKGRS
jgi:hypothetical protein